MKKLPLILTVTLLILLSFVSCGGQVEKNESDAIAVSVCPATEEQLSNESGYVHFYDTDSINTEWKILLTVESQVESLSFTEIDESEGTKLGKVLFEERSPSVGTSYVFHTYLNDATLNRGITYVDKSGNVRNFGIAVSMKDGTLYLKEIEARA